MLRESGLGLVMTSTPLQRVLRFLWEAEPEAADAPIVALGSIYSPEVDPNNPNGVVWPELFLQDAESRVWLMYRTSFTLIPKHPDGPTPLRLTTLLRGNAIDPNGFVSDVGWGCMIRTGQSLLANALFIQHLGRDWRFTGEADRTQQKILELFFDEQQAPLSIHRFVEHGAAHCGKLPGEWFGPSAVASCIRALVAESPATAAAESVNLKVYVSDGMEVYEDKLRAVAVEDGKWQPTLVLCGIRLGISSVNPIYYDGLRALLDSPQAVGIAGGRTSASHYFYAYQGERLLYHDPHDPRPALKTGATQEDLQTVHSRRLRALPFGEMDPSMLVGFLLETEDDFKAWKQQMLAIDASKRAINITDSPAAEYDGIEEEDFVLCEPDQVLEDAEVETPKDPDDSWVGSEEFESRFNSTPTSKADAKPELKHYPKQDPKHDSKESSEGADADSKIQDEPVQVALPDSADDPPVTVTGDSTFGSIGERPESVRMPDCADECMSILSISSK